MTMRQLTPAQVALVAEQFKALAEPARLQILLALGSGEMTVTQLRGATGLGQANLSKHLQVLRSGNFVGRRRGGPFMYYRVADADVFRLCELMCNRLERRSAADERLFPTGA